MLQLVAAEVNEALISEVSNQISEISGEVRASLPRLLRVGIDFIELNKFQRCSFSWLLCSLYANGLSRFKPFRWSASSPGAERNDASDDGGIRIAVTARANRFAQRIDKVVQVIRGDPKAKRNGIWSGDERAVAERTSCI